MTGRRQHEAARHRRVLPLPRVARRAAALLVTLVAAALLVFAGPAAPAHASPFGCKGNIGIKQPDKTMTWTPEGSRKFTKDADPFKDKSIPPQLVYGWSADTFHYDNGCSPTSGVMPSIGEFGANLMGEWIPNIISSQAYVAMRSVVDPSWLGPLDKPLATATRQVAASTWTPYLTVVILLIASIMLWRARQGELSGTVTAGMWALLVLIVVTWTTSYPMEAPHMVDSGIQSGVTTVSGSFGHEPLPCTGPDQGKCGDETAPHAVDRMFGQVWWSTTYRTWAEAEFGDANSATALKYGPSLYKNTHLTFYEAAKAKQDSKAGDKIKSDKKHEAENIVEKIHNEDPTAYDYLTGNQWGDRILTGFIGLIVVLTMVAFLAVAAFGMLLGYLSVRIAVPFSPAVGLACMFDTVREKIKGIGGKFAGVLVAGPVYLLASLVVLKINTAVASAPDINFLLRTIIMAIVSWVAWKLTKPGTYLPGHAATRKATRKLGSFAGSLLGSAIGSKAGNEAADDKDERAKIRGRKPRGEPVYESDQSQRRGPFTKDLETADANGAVYVDGYLDAADSGTQPNGGDGLPDYDALPVRRTSPGTFVHRDEVAPAPVSARRRRALSIAPAHREHPAATSEHETEPLVTHVEPDAVPSARGDHGPGRARVLLDPAEMEGPRTDGAVRGQAPVTGRTYPPGESLPVEVHEANQVIDADGRAVFQIYRPEGSETYVSQVDAQE